MQDLAQNTKPTIAKSWPQKQYLLLFDENGKVIIIDAITYEEITNYNLPEIKYNIVAVIQDTLYRIDTINGKIQITNIENIINGEIPIPWIHAGSFPPDGPGTWIANSIAVDQQFIYFVTNNGPFYLYDTILRTVEKLGDITAGHPYASMTVLNSVVYIHKFSNFYSYDGSNIKELSPPDERFNCGLFQYDNKICRVGGNNTDVNPDPVTCYNPSDESWSTVSYINEARWFPATVNTETGTCIFGGSNRYSDLEHWRNSAEIFNYQKKIWSYIPFPLVKEDSFLQATVFYY